MDNSENIVSQILLLKKKVDYYKATVYDKNFKVNSYSVKELSEKQFIILLLLGYCGINSMTHIAKVLEQSTGSLSNIMTKMVKEGYIYKIYPENGQDRRRIYYEITDRGLQILNKYISDCSKDLESFFVNMSEDSIQLFNTGYNKIELAVEDANQTEIFQIIKNFKMGDNKDSFSVDLLKRTIIIVAWTTKRYAKELEDFIQSYHQKLTPGKLRVLAELCMYEYESISKMAENIQASESTISTALSKLAEDGYVIRAYPKEDEDGRKVYYSPTEKGKDAFNHIKNKLFELIKTYFESLSEEKKVNLSEGLDHLIKSFE